MNTIKWIIAILVLSIFIAWLTITPLQVFEEILKVLINFEWNQGENIILQSEYDFIIVGAGTAGCVIANRLSENPNWNILLIEAGPDETTIMDIPAFVHFLQTSNKINWKYQTEPSNEYCLAMTNQQCNWPRGKVMGGSSVLNYMMYTRGNRRDFDQWAKMGNDEWSFAHVEPYFRKLENSTIIGDNVLGHNGPLSIEYVDYKSDVSKIFVDAVQELGLPIVDYDGKEQIGVSYAKSTTKSGYRYSSNRAYIDPIKHRTNLHIKKKSFVTKIIVNNERKQATGVTFTQNNEIYTINARKEIIISAGAINSPHLLMLSGIGPLKHLRENDIEPIVDLPVGQNLMDHYIAGTFTFKVDGVKTIKEEMENLTNWRPYFRNGSGILGILGGCETITFFNTEQFNKKDVYPDVEMIQAAGAVYEIKDLAMQNFNIDPKIFEEIYGEMARAKQRAFSLSLFLTQPKSRGKIELRNNDPYTYPRLYANYLSDPDDIETMIRGVRQLIKLEKTKAFRKVNATFYPDNITKCNHLEYDSNKYWECYFRHMGTTVYHYSGTCKMGSPTDPTAVVNSQLQVIGVKNLRVADASVMPVIISGHPNAAIFMIGEKVSDMIKKYWSER